jgi:SagB-type dehydrogenase family enzyme
MKTKQFIITLFTCVLSLTLYAQDLQVIELNNPDKTRGTTVMKALNDRHSERAFDQQDLKPQDLADLLWAAIGVNRPDGRRTAPTAMNKQEVDLYVVDKNGAYLYDAQQHALLPKAKGDFRSAVAGGQDFVKTAPISIVLVVNLEKLGDPNNERTKLMAAVDAGIVTQNVNIFCAATGLATVPRASMDHDELKKILKLGNTQLPIMNNPVGYPAK